MASGPPPLPAFLIIGAQKSATRWLRLNLGRHPDIYTAPKELHFFNHRRFVTHGVDWYRAQFTGWAGEPLVGESTPGYMMWRHAPRRVAERIQLTLPDVKLIAVLRDPIARAQSALDHHIRRRRIPEDADLLDLVRDAPPGQDRYGLITGGWYARSLAPYKELFGDRLLVMLHDDVREDAAAAYARALDHIGADSSVIPEDVGKVVFSNRRRSTRRPLSLDEREELFDYFRADVKQLSEMFDLDLSRWEVRASPAELSQQLEHAYAPFVAWMQDVLSRITPAQMHVSVSDDRTVGELVFDLVEEAWMFAHLFLGKEAAKFDPSRVTDIEWLRRTFGWSSATLVSALRDPENLIGDIATPFGVTGRQDFGRSVVLRQITAGWEFATAVGCGDSMPPEVGRAGLRLARRMFRYGYASIAPQLVEFVRVHT